MANTILLKRSSVANAAPLAADLDYGELAINYNTGALYFKNSSNTVQVLATTASATGPGGANTQIQFNDNGIFGGSAGLTFDKTSNLVSATGNVSAAYFLGDGSQLTGLTPSLVANGTSNVSIPVASGNVNFSVGGVPNVTVATSGGLTVSGNVDSLAFVAGIYMATKKTITSSIEMEPGVNAITYGMVAMAPEAFVQIPNSSTWHFTNIYP